MTRVQQWLLSDISPRAENADAPFCALSYFSTTMHMEEKWNAEYSERDTVSGHNRGLYDSSKRVVVPVNYFNM